MDFLLIAHTAILTRGRPSGPVPPRNSPYDCVLRMLFSLTLATLRPRRCARRLVTEPTRLWRGWASSAAGGGVRTMFIASCLKREGSRLSASNRISVPESANTSRGIALVSPPQASHYASNRVAAPCEGQGSRGNLKRCCRGPVATRGPYAGPRDLPGARMTPLQDRKRNAISRVADKGRAPLSHCTAPCALTLALALALHLKLPQGRRNLEFLVRVGRHVWQAFLTSSTDGSQGPDAAEKADAMRGPASLHRGTQAISQGEAGAPVCKPAGRSKHLKTAQTPYTIPWCFATLFMVADSLRQRPDHVTSVARLLVAHRQGADEARCAM